ncbi:hypothetical protein R3I93_020664 [Phoxinus phoxinus]|uniref:Uncharacterized protein n=1 Tax=Phoxinus phoxinus TaxID=58324 RepID=A0AAN9CA50_9TELE
MEPHGQLIPTLLVLVLVTYICEAALLRKSSAVDFLREKRAVRCQHGGCSSEDSEAEELLEANSDYEQDNSKMFINGGSQVGAHMRPDGEPQGEGSGM